MFHAQALELRAMMEIIFRDELSLCVRPVSVGSYVHSTRKRSGKLVAARHEPLIW